MAKLVISLVAACYAQTAGAVTLQTVLQTTLGSLNPAIQEAKSGLEQAAGQRLVFRLCRLARR